jgi:predicted acylesterase/phospholipase RssA
MEKEEEETENRPIIKHLVMAGGGSVGLSMYGIIRESNKANLWNIKNIKTIYGTSSSSLLGVIIALNFDWDILDDYIINRPWEQVYNFDFETIFNVLETRGIFDKTVFVDTLSPLFKAKDISLDITIKEFYELTGIETHFFSTEINEFKLVDFSYKTHPDWKIIDAVFCSSALPILMKPLIINEDCYCDGGIFMNYPIDPCIENGAIEDEIIGIIKESNTETNVIDENANVFEYLSCIIYKITNKVLSSKQNEKIRYKYSVFSPPVNAYNILMTASSTEERMRLIQLGSDIFHEKK